MYVTDRRSFSCK